MLFGTRRCLFSDQRFLYLARSNHHWSLNPISAKEVIEGSPLEISTGAIAALNDASVLLKYRNTTLLATVSSVDSFRPRAFSLRVDYREKQAAMGRFLPKRERETDKEMAISMTLERSLIPFFKMPLSKEVRVSVACLSYDGKEDLDVHAFNAASAALSISPLQWMGPIAAVRIANLKENPVIFPTFEQRAKAKSEILYVGGKDQVTLLKFFGSEVSPRGLFDSTQLSRKRVEGILSIQEELIKKVNPLKQPIPLQQEIPFELRRAVKNLAEEALIEILSDPLLPSNVREKALQNVNTVVRNKLRETFPSDFDLNEALNDLKKEVIKHLLLQGKRPDGRALTEPRKNVILPNILPNVTPATSLYQRGHIQVLTTVTFGSKSSGEQGAEKMLICSSDSLSQPNPQIGKVQVRSQVELGLTLEDSLKGIMCENDKFGFITRINSDILSSDGDLLSISIANASFAMAQAGIPITNCACSSNCSLVLDSKQSSDLNPTLPPYQIISDPTHIELLSSDLTGVVSGTSKGITSCIIKSFSPLITPQLVFEVIDQAVKDFKPKISETEALLRNLPQKKQPMVPGFSFVFSFPFSHFYILSFIS